MKGSANILTAPWTERGFSGAVLHATLALADRLVGTRRSLVFRHESHTSAGHEAARRYASRDESWPRARPCRQRMIPD